MSIDYDGRRFRARGEQNGPGATYRQRGDLVWAEFAGGHVRRGSLVGVCNGDGVLSLGYSMVLAGGEVITGRCTSTPHWQVGRLELREVWQRYGEHAATGESILEEVPAADPTGESR